MRQTLYLVGFAAVATVVTGAFAFGCSNSSSSPPPSNDGSAPTTDAAMGGAETSTETDSSTGTPGSDAGEDAACTPLMGMYVNTLDASAWQCYRTMCLSTLNECAADCTCNNALLMVLNCQNNCMSDGGDPVNCQTTCAGPILSASGDASIDTVLCLMPLSPASDGVCAQMAMGEGGTAGDTGTGTASDAGAGDAAHD